MTSLETDRLRLRPLTQDDLPDVHRLHSDPQAVRFASGRLKSLLETEIAYWIVREHWGRGLATEAASASRDHGFKTLGRARLISIIHPDNRASRRVAEKVGLRVEKSATHKGVEVLIYSIEASERGDREPCAET